MSNTIRRARRRPRVRSINWRTFGWLLLRVAVLNIHEGDFRDRTAKGDLRRYLRDMQSHRVRSLGRFLLVNNPERRIRP